MIATMMMASGLVARFVLRRPDLRAGEMVSFRHRAIRRRFPARLLNPASGHGLWWVRYAWPDGREGETLARPSELRRPWIIRAGGTASSMR